ncbi:biotin--[acetyl-CoA-carboxylase] ligase [Candidatus Neptunochlamydia vexilliferae]|uniref:BPL/LPL catalytic domain-containing protein n=1 Tax=Candidatus Neptunichlamydia vexilliferae TaxID=1651774 RepID=A0ABS0B1G6_9BACT|nr:biotin--[acetyl-CoA-carboxylase] ligase [Candidatus Neptunochlamydia vexilliferae]MBF5059380.1 hypothetical protein [Candidatus Neptunochlamydia vexilliferae]
MVEKVTPIHLESIDSTNTYAKNNYQNFDPKGWTRITATEQTGGRGRFNREWVSPKGESIYLTYYFTMEKEKADLGNLTQVLSLSIVKLLQKEGLKGEIKWPNDVLIGGKKIAGILAETIDLQEKWGVILGMGINVNVKKETLDPIDQPATSFLVETGKSYDMSSLIAMLEMLFLTDYDLYLEKGFAHFYKEYDALLTHKGKEITLHQNGTSISGTLHSLSPDGRINILLPSGEVETFHSGEIK